MPDIAPEHSADPLGSIDPLSAAYKQICIKLYKQQQEIIALLTEAVRLAPIPPRSDFHRHMLRKRPWTHGTLTAERAHLACIAYSQVQQRSFDIINRAVEMARTFGLDHSKLSEAHPHESCIL